MGRGRLKDCRVVVLGKQKSSSDKQLGWLAHLGGRHVELSDNDITHVIIGESKWKQQGPDVTRALELEAEAESAGKQPVYIVSFQWLEDCAMTQTRKKETSYLWPVMDPKTCGREEKLGSGGGKGSRTRGKGKKSGEGAGSHKRMMIDLLEESTEPHVDERQRKRVEKQIRREKELENQRLENDKMERARAKEVQKQQAMIFAHGAKKARNQLFSENYHVYSDSMNFRYDILLTKIDTRNNRNERYAITLYESNSSPHTYATNCQFAGTGKLASNQILVGPTGCTFVTAFHAFKKTFKELTGGDWDSRISDHLARVSDKKAGVSTSTSARATSEGRRNGKQTAAADDLNYTVEDGNFTFQGFVYHPPSNGPLGDLSEEDAKCLTRFLEQEAKRRSEDERAQLGAQPNDEGVGAAESEGQRYAEEREKMKKNKTRAAQPETKVRGSIGARMDDAWPENAYFVHDQGQSLQGVEGTPTLWGGSEDTFNFDPIQMFGSEVYPFQQNIGDIQDDFFNDNGSHFPPSTDLYQGNLSFQPEEQSVDETQMAMFAQGELEALNNRPPMAPMLERNQGSSNSITEWKGTAMPDLGPSILGKRKERGLDPITQMAKRLAAADPIE